METNEHGTQYVQNLKMSFAKSETISLWNGFSYLRMRLTFTAPQIQSNSHNHAARWAHTHTHFN